MGDGVGAGHLDSRTLLEAKMSAGPLSLSSCGCRHYMYHELLVSLSRTVSHPSPSLLGNSPQDSQIRGLLSAGYSEENPLGLEGGVLW